MIITVSVRPVDIDGFLASDPLLSPREFVKTAAWFIEHLLEGKAAWHPPNETARPWNRGEMERRCDTCP